MMSLIYMESRKTREAGVKEGKNIRIGREKL